MEKVRHGKIVRENEKKKDIIVSLIVTVVFSSLMSLALITLLTPIGLYGAGLTGVGQIALHIIELVSPALEWNDLISYLGMINFFLLLPFDILAYFKLSKKYALYTFVSTLVQSLVMLLAEPLSSLMLFSVGGVIDKITCVIVSAIILGICDGMLMRRGATSGGIIVLCQYYNLKKGKSVGVINVIICSIVIVCGAFLAYFADPVRDISTGLSTALYTLLCYVLQSIVLDYVHTSYNKVKLEIITENGKLISSELVKAFPHGVTVFKAVGAYTGNEKDVLDVVIQKNEVNKYLSIIKSLDSEAFISITPVWRLTGRFNIQVIDK